MCSQPREVLVKKRPSVDAENSGKLTPLCKATGHRETGDFVVHAGLNVGSCGVLAQVACLGT